MKDLSLNDRLSVPDAVVSRELDGETVLLNLDTGIYFGLDAVATAIWRSIQNGSRLGDAVAALAAEYEADAATLRDDVLRLAGQLVAKGLLTPAPSP
jgi:hypothetical protein